MITISLSILGAYLIGLNRSRKLSAEVPPLSGTAKKPPLAAAATPDQPSTDQVSPTSTAPSSNDSNDASPSQSSQNERSTPWTTEQLLKLGEVFNTTPAVSAGGSWALVTKDNRKIFVPHPFIESPNVSLLWIQCDPGMPNTGVVGLMEDIDSPGSIVDVVTIFGNESGHDDAWRMSDSYSINPTNSRSFIFKLINSSGGYVILSSERSWSASFHISGLDKKLLSQSCEILDQGTESNSSSEQSNSLPSDSSAPTHAEH